MSRPPPKFRLRWLFLGGLVFLLGLVFWQTRESQRKVDVELVALRALNVPTTPAEMRAFVAIPEEQNAAPLFVLAMASLEKHGRQMPSGVDGGSEEDAANAIRAWVLAHEATLDLVKAAAAKPGCDFEREWELGMNVSFPELAEMKSIIRLVARRAALEAEAGRFEEAIEWLSVGRRVARHANEPTLIGMLVSIACETIVQAEFQRQTVLYGTRAPFRRAAAPFVQQPGPLPAYDRALSGEVLFVHSTLGTMENMNPNELAGMIGGVGNEIGMLQRLQLASLRTSLVRNRVTAKLLGRSRRAIESIRAADGAIDAQQKASVQMDIEFATDQSWAGALAEILGSVFAQAGATVVKLETNRRLSHTGLVLFELRATTGKFPPALPPEPWAIDPHNGKPFVYDVGPNSFTLYSLGANGIDDGGRKSTGNPHTDDIAFDPTAPK